MNPIVRYLSEHPDGSTVGKVARAVGLSPRTVADRLTLLRNAGLADRVGGKDWLWGTPEHVAALRSALRRRADERRRERQRGHYQRSHGTDEAFQHRIIPAADAPPIVTRAISSVWGLAPESTP